MRENGAMLRDIIIFYQAYIAAVFETLVAPEICVGENNNPTV